MLPRLTSGFVIRGLLAAAAALLVLLPDVASALPRDRIAARRLARILPPGSTLTLPATPVPPRRAAVVRVPVTPAVPQTASRPAAQPAAPAPQAAAAPPAQQPAVAGGVQQAAGTAAAAKTATPTAAWTLDAGPTGDGTKSVLVPDAQQPTPAAPIELLPTP